MTTQAKREVDPDFILSSQVAQALSVIGDRWAFLIIRDVYLGARRFEDLRQRTEAARGTLTSRLKSLVAAGILYKEPYQQSPTRYEYRLTEKGLDFEDICTSYLERIKPMHLRFVVASKRHADIIVPMGGRNIAAVEMVISRIQTALAQGADTETESESV